MIEAQFTRNLKLQNEALRIGDSYTPVADPSQSWVVNLDLFEFTNMFICNDLSDFKVRLIFYSSGLKRKPAASVDIRLTKWPEMTT